MSKPGGQSSSSDYWPARDDDNQPANAEHNPHTRAIGGTFEFTFILPKPANSGGRRPKPRQAAKPSRKANAGTAKSTGPKLTEEQKRELRRVRAAEKRQRRKELGLCKDCPNEATKGRIRCPDCTKKHNKAGQTQRKSAEAKSSPR